MKNTILVLVMCFILGPSIHAQIEGTPLSSTATVHLKSGTKLQGKIIEWDVGKSITLEMPWGAQISLTQNQIKKVVQNITSNKKGFDLTPYNFPDSVFYYSLKTQVISGNEGARAHGVFGFGLSASIGYRFNRLLSIGVGAGYDKYIWDSGEELVPIFAEFSGYLTPSHTSLFYNLQLGYSLASKSNNFFLIDAQGGLMTYPSIGIRFGSQKVKTTLDIGYKFQNAEFTYRDAWTPTDRSEQDVLFKRLCIRFGLIW